MRFALCSSLLLVAAVALLLSPVSGQSDACRFAPSFDADQLFNDPAAQAEFINTVMQREAKFLQPNPCITPEQQAQHPDVDLTNIGYHAATGMTLDGHRWTVEEGLPLGEPHLFTAASKESLHLAMLALALAGQTGAQTFISPNLPSNASARAIEVLALKVNTIDAFFQTFPGFGGFLPWVYVSDAGLTPTADFNSSVPSLDNGQMFWGAYAVAKVLSDSYSHVLATPLPGFTHTSDDNLYLNPATTLAQRWTNIYTRMIDNALIVFYDSRTNSTLGQFRTVSQIVDRTLPIDPTISAFAASANYEAAGAGGPSYLNDPYEGELFTNMAFLFADWSWTGASSDSTWLYKRGMLQPVGFEVPANADGQGNPAQTAFMVLEKGYWFSGHEKWKFWLMPYLSSTWSRQVFLSGEKARVWNSVMSGLPGGYASAAGMASTDTQDTGYLSDCGVGSLAFETVNNVDVISPYAFASLFLADPSYGLAWYHAFLMNPRAQTCFGSIESVNRTGMGFSPLSTWDTKVTTLLAMNGGLGPLVAQALANEPIVRAASSYTDGAGGTGTTLPTGMTNAMELFVWVLDREWSRLFEGVPLGEYLDFTRPQTKMPQIMDEWPSCSSKQAECQC